MSREDTQFKPGQSGNPAGKPKGARNKLSEDFLYAMAEDFAKGGAEAIANTRINKPEAYLGAIVRLMPKLMELSGPDSGPIAVMPFEFVESQNPEGTAE